MERYAIININEITHAGWVFLELNTPTSLFKDKLLPKTLIEAIKYASSENRDTIVTCVY